MEIEWRLLVPLLGVLAATILLTGPGMWSDSWGWWWVRKDRSKDRATRRR